MTNRNKGSTNFISIGPDANSHTTVRQRNRNSIEFAGPPTSGVASTIAHCRQRNNDN